MSKEPHIEISSGIVKMSERHSHEGKRLLLNEIGERMFFVDAFEGECAATLWSGKSYEQAMIEAEDMSREGWGPVVDRVLT